jgi:pectinesterase
MRPIEFYSEIKRVAMRLSFFYITLFLPFFTAGQSPFPRDTSFTVYSAYNREVKKYPFIQLVKPQSLKDIRKEENVVFRNVGRDLRLDIFYPSKKNNRGYPAVLLIHGGGWRSGDRSQAVPFAQHLAVKGYVAIAVEYRLSVEAPYPAAVYDLKAAVRWLRTNASPY